MSHLVQDLGESVIRAEGVKSTAPQAAFVAISPVLHASIQYVKPVLPFGILLKMWVSMCSFYYYEYIKN